MKYKKANANELLKRIDESQMLATKMEYYRGVVWCTFIHFLNFNLISALAYISQQLHRQSKTAVMGVQFLRVHFRQ